MQASGALPWMFWVNPWAWRKHILSLSAHDRIVFVTKVCDWAVRAGTTTVGLWVTALGLAIGLGGSTRLSAPSFQVINEVLPPWGWAAIPILGGLMLSTGSVYRGIVVPAAFLLSCWSLAWATCLTLAIPLAPGAAVTGVVTYYALALLLLGIAVVHGLIGLAAKGAARAYVTPLPLDWETRA